MNRTETLNLFRPGGDLDRLRRTDSAAGPASLSIEGVGTSASEAEGARRAAPDAAPARASAPASPPAAKRPRARITIPIHGAFAFERIGDSPSSRSATTSGPRRERGLLAALALATGLAFGLGASPIRAEAKGDAGQVLKAYGAMYEALVTNKTEGVAESAARIAGIAGECAEAGAVAKECGALAAAAKKVVGTNLESLRAQFNELSVRVDHYLRATKAEGWALYYCPMAPGFWIQTAEGVRNPYYGPSMLRCGDRVPGPAVLD